MKKLLLIVLLFIQLKALTQVASDTAGLLIKTRNGLLQGMNQSGIRIFLGVPFAAPPIGENRWKEPQPLKSWEGIRKAEKFGPKPMQRAIFGDMGFRTNEMSEDCLYLNIWAPANTKKEKLPVLVYFYGGGLMAGDGSEPRYDGEALARKGIITLTVNYRLNVFGFFSHPELSKESPKGASGNYGFLDQAAALKWISENIGAFGGDPKRVTIAGESAGSVSVSAHMVSPLSKHLISQAIGSSGSLMGTLPAVTLQEREQKGVEFAKHAKANSLSDLRNMSANALLEASTNREFEFFGPAIDGYFLTEAPVKVFESNRQAQVPMLLGWNSEEMTFRALMRGKELNQENYRQIVQELYGDKAEEILKVYGGSDAELEQAATDLAGDRFTGFSTWKWSDIHFKTSGKPVYRYLFSRPRPQMRPEFGNSVAGLAGGVSKSKDSSAPKPPMPKGAVHSAEIEYAMGNLPSNRVYDWSLEDYRVSEVFQEYYVNFVRTGNPNGPTVPVWPRLEKNSVQVMIIDAETRAIADKHADRYQLLNKLYGKK